MHENHTTTTAAAGPQEGEIDLLDMLLVVARAKTAILRITVAAAVLSAAVALLLPPVYTANALILPPQQDRSGLDSMAMSALSELSSAGGGGVGAVLGLKNPADLYIGMLKSRSVMDAVIRRFKLQELYGKASLVDTREELQKQLSISSRDDGLISIMFDDHDAKRAAEVANAFVEELEKLTRHIAISEAAQRRLFIERQLQQTRDKLAQSENTLIQTQEHTGVIDLDSQGKAIIEAVATLRAQAAAKEVQIAAMQSYATPGNPDLIRARQELAGLRAQAGKMEHDKPSGNGDLMVSTGKLPEAGLEYLRKLRDMKYQQALYEMLAKQYEIAKVDEARNSVVIQVVDPAVALDEETGPRRILIVVLTTVMALILAVMGAFLRVALLQMRQCNVQRTRMDELGALLRPKRRV